MSLLTIVIAAVIFTSSSVIEVALGMAPVTAHDGIALLLLLVVVGGGSFFGWRINLFARALAIFRIRELGREGVIAGQALAAGRLDEARVRYAKLLHWAQPLAAYHATFVGLWGVLRFLEGDTAEGLELVERVDASGWLSHPRMSTIGSTLNAWRVLMLLTLGRGDEARKLLPEDDEPAFRTARLVLAAHDARFGTGSWDCVIEGAMRAIEDISTPITSRPTLVLLGQYAARQSHHPSLARFEELLAIEPISAGVRKNPALKPFL